MRTTYFSCEGDRWNGHPHVVVIAIGLLLFAVVAGLLIGALRPRRMPVAHDRYGLQLTHEDRVSSIRTAVLDDGVGGRVVGWRNDDLDTMRLPQWVFAARSATVASDRALSDVANEPVMPPPIEHADGEGIEMARACALADENHEALMNARTTPCEIATIGSSVVDDRRSVERVASWHDEVTKVDNWVLKRAAVCEAASVTPPPIDQHDRDGMIALARVRVVKDPDDALTMPYGVAIVTSRVQPDRSGIQLADDRASMVGSSAIGGTPSSKPSVRAQTPRTVIPVPTMPRPSDTARTRIVRSPIVARQRRLQTHHAPARDGQGHPHHPEVAWPLVEPNNRPKHQGDGAPHREHQEPTRPHRYEGRRVIK